MAEILQQIREEMQRTYKPRDGNTSIERAGADPPPSGDLAEVRSALAALHASYALVGQRPPEPPTLRGRLGARLVKIVQRLLFWYTPQIVHFQYSALRAFESALAVWEGQAGRVQQLETERRELQAAISATASQAEAAERRLEAEIAARIAVLQTAHDEAREAEAHARASLAAQLDSLRSQVFPRLEREVLRLKPLQIAQDRRISLLLEEARKRWPEPFDASQMQRLCEEERHDMDALYAALEDEFRGSREEIKDRLTVYLPKLGEAGIGSQDMPILDAGCGRGEWLELLREHHLQASGIDLNRVNIAMCRERGLAAQEAEAVAYLGGLPEASLGAVTAFHLIEHLPLPQLIDLLDATVRALKPGGVAIFETPNPNNILVSSRYFYLDPTHRHPIPPQLGQFLAEARGLRRIEIVELHPWPETHHVDTRTNGEVAGRFNECFYGPQDYAIIGWKV